MKRSILAMAITIGLSASACSEENQMTAEEVKSTIGRELAQGASADAIERFFTTHKLQYTYDRFAKRYQSVIRDASADPNVDQAIVIHVYVDDSKTFVRGEVRDSFTYP
jgi:hypothetical protein